MILFPYYYTLSHSSDARYLFPFVPGQTPQKQKIP